VPKDGIVSFGIEMTDEDDEKWVLHDRFGFALLYLLVKGTEKIKNKKIVP